MVNGLLLWPLLLAPSLSAHVLPPVSGTGSEVILQVPFIAQSELLCGGAAIAMLERWWGRRDVQAADFAGLVRPSEGGIRTTDLVLATQERGWQTRVARGTAPLVQQSIRDSVPVIALIQVAPTRYHYVVILGWNDVRVTYHDPAVGPFATLATKEFLQRWHGADDWALLVRPPLPTVSPLPLDTAVPSPEDSLPCRPWLDEAAGAAINNHLSDAEGFLVTAATACPSEPLVLRELAGVRFRQGRYAEATQLTDKYLRRASGDSLGWQLLASSRYLAADREGALQAWNAIGRPPVDLVVIDGSHRIRFGILARAIGLEPGTVLTPARLALARRRMADIPALALAHVGYAAVAGGAVEVRAAVAEDPLVGSPPRLLVSGVVRAAVRQEARLGIASPFGAGEMWTLQWRWSAAAPRRALHLDIPTRIGVPGIVSLERSSQEWHFASTVPPRALPPERQSATTLGFAAWLHADVEAAAGARYERWNPEGQFLALSLGGALHRWHDHVVFSLEGERGVSLSSPQGYSRAATRLTWATPAPSSGMSWSARLGADWSSAATPLGLWPVAGGDLGRNVPLRAHPFFVGNFLPADRSGRRILQGGVAGDRTLGHIGPLQVGAGLFVDGAQVTATAGGATMARSYLDGGAGLLFAIAGMQATTLRIDLARGLLTDRRWGLTVGLQPSWPRRLGALR